MNVGIFVASLSSASVEFFETAAIAYAIFRSGYPREALWGTMTGLMGVGLVSAVMGTGLQYLPVRLLQVAIGLVLLWFGWGWSKKALLRQVQHKRAGWVANPLDSEGIVLETGRKQFSRLNFLVMTKSATIEALEVALVVVTLGLASGTWTETVAGAGVALVLTVAVVAILHGYLLTVPDVWLKLSAGVMLLSYGTFWLAAGMGFASPLGEFTLLLLMGVYSLASLLAMRQLQPHV